MGLQAEKYAPHFTAFMFTVAHTSGTWCGYICTSEWNWSADGCCSCPLPPLLAAAGAVHFWSRSKQYLPYHLL